MKMKNTDECLKKQKTWRARVVLERRTLRQIWERKEYWETESEIYMVEREISSAKVGVAFSNRDDEKILFTRFHSRVVSDHVYQQ